MHTEFSKTVRTTAVAPVLATGAGIVLGTAPATSSTIDFELASHSTQKPA